MIGDFFNQTIKSSPTITYSLRNMLLCRSRNLLVGTCVTAAAPASTTKSRGLIIEGFVKRRNTVPFDEDLAVVYRFRVISQKNPIISRDMGDIL